MAYNFPTYFVSFLAERIEAILPASRNCIRKGFIVYFTNFIIKQPLFQHANTSFDMHKSALAKLNKCTYESSVTDVCPSYI